MKWDFMSLSDALEHKLQKWMSNYWAFVLSGAFFPFGFFMLLFILQEFTPEIVGHFGCGLVLCYLIASMVYYEFKKRRLKRI